MLCTAEPTLENNHSDMLLSRSWNTISRDVSGLGECSIQNQTIKVTHQHKLLCRPRQLLNPYSHAATLHEHLEHDTMSDSHVNE